MSRTYDVVIERENGHFRATLLDLPRVSAEADTRDEALQQLQQTAANYLRRVELTTIELEAPATALRPGTPSAVLQAITSCQLDTTDPLYQEYLADPEAEEKRQREEAEEAAELETNKYPLAEAWARKAGLPRKDPNDPVYQQYLATLAELKLQDRESVQREFAIAAEMATLREEGQLGSPQSVLKAIANCRIDPHDPIYQEYVAAMEAEEQRQQEEFERENPENI